MVRWFQYGAFCPLLRLHGNREPVDAVEPDETGGPNELWSYGDEAYEIIADAPAACASGCARTSWRRCGPRARDRPPADAPAVPANSPTTRRHGWSRTPSCSARTCSSRRSRRPASGTGPCTARRRAWTDAWTGAEHEGGQMVTVAAPIERIPLFLREGARLPIRVES